MLTWIYGTDKIFKAYALKANSLLARLPKKRINSIYCLVSVRIIWRRGKPHRHIAAKSRLICSPFHVWLSENAPKSSESAKEMEEKTSILKIKQSKLHFTFLYYLHTVRLIASSTSFGHGGSPFLRTILFIRFSSSLAISPSVRLSACLSICLSVCIFFEARNMILVSCIIALTLFHLTNESPLLMGNLRAMSNLFHFIYMVRSLQTKH